MYIEKLKELDIFDLFPSLARSKNVLFNEDDTNILFYTVQIDYTYVFEQLLHLKFPNNMFKTSYFKENTYSYNEFAYILDCNEWNIQEFTEFIVEYSKLNSVIMKPNLFILYNIDILDKNTQNLLGTLVETSYKKSRYWFFCNQIGRVSNKIIHRVLNISIGKNSVQNFKKNLLKLVDEPIFEIIIDKIIEKSNGDYGAALLYLDMLSIDPTILNRELFSQERAEIKRFIEDEKYTIQNYPGLREICFRLLEKMELLEIFCNFNLFFKDIFTPYQYSLVLSKCAEYQALDKIPNKQAWLLEAWFLDCITIYRGIDVKHDVSKNKTRSSLVI
jgi:hypothetical protein